MKYQATGGGLGFTTVCHIGRRTVTSSGVATGDFKNSYSVDVTTRMDPPPPGLPRSPSATQIPSPPGPGSKSRAVSL